MIREKAEKGARVAGTDAERMKLVREALASSDSARQQRMAAWLREHDGLIDTPYEDLESEFDANELNDNEPTPYLEEEYRRGYGYGPEMPQPEEPAER